MCARVALASGQHWAKYQCPHQYLLVSCARGLPLSVCSFLYFYHCKNPISDMKLHLKQLDIFAEKTTRTLILGSWLCLSKTSSLIDEFIISLCWYPSFCVTLKWICNLGLLLKVFHFFRKSGNQNCLSAY